MTTQTEMDYYTQENPTKEMVNASEQMLRVLVNCKSWQTRKDMLLHGFNDRLCRMCRQHSGSKIISGQKGYKATELATLEEINHSANALESQAKVMLEEAIELRRLAHSRIH